MLKILDVVFSLIIAVSLLLFLPIAASAKSSAKPTLSASVAKNKRYINVSFGNLANTKRIKYQLIYNSTKGSQGVSGTLSPKAKSLSRQLALGTCSKNVCVYHQDVKGIILSVDYTLKSGGIISYSKKL